ncbi:hypothetical protein [Stenotrophomonas sp.]|uniref:hypothetical protein n=1 Tax=Stenotrophomonas sp. TaxID=69392 RepID=UPI0028A63CB5|nr:hypothetical protein [Stenotrophomonas sp.]
MPKPEKELRIRDEQRDLGEELLEAVRAFKNGRIGKVHVMRLAEEGDAIDRVSFALAGDEFQQFVDHLDAPLERNPGLDRLVRLIPVWDKAREKA